MILDQDKTIEKFGKKVGFVFGYFLFTTILFFLLNASNKIPDFWSYFHIMGITLSITLVGAFLKRHLK